MQAQSFGMFVDLLMLVLIFFMTRWQARDLYNALHVSLILMLCIGIGIYFSVYFGVAYFAFAGGVTELSRAKAAAILLVLWSLVWIPIFVSIQVLSKPVVVVAVAGDDLLLERKPSSELAKGTIDTSLEACKKLAVCDQSVEQTNFTAQVEERASCDACLEKNLCPVHMGDGTIQCQTGSCNVACAGADMIERYSLDNNCPNALQYVNATPGAVGRIGSLCSNDLGFCVYGCDTKADMTTGKCPTGWRSYTGELMPNILTDVERNQGFTAESECLLKYKSCAKLDCASQPISPPSAAVTNCYCELHVPLTQPPCRRLENLCDRTSPQYSAAKVLAGSKTVAAGIQNSDTAALALSVQQKDAEVANALMF